VVWVGEGGGEEGALEEPGEEEAEDCCQWGEEVQSEVLLVGTYVGLVITCLVIPMQAQMNCKS
jgi:hypothetical protein